MLFRRLPYQRQTLNLSRVVQDCHVEFHYRYRSHCVVFSTRSPVSPKFADDLLSDWVVPSDFFKLIVCENQVFHVHLSDRAANTEQPDVRKLSEKIEEGDIWRKSQPNKPVHSGRLIYSLRPLERGCGRYK
jgi:hypothetical protein